MTISYPNVAGRLPYLGGIVTDLCALVGVTSVNTTVIDGIVVRGFMVASGYTAADSIRALQRGYFFDFVEIDGVLTVVMRGGAVAATITRADMVRGQEAKFETERQQGVEFPRKLHVAYTSAETDYVATKETSERRSADVQSLSEGTVEIPVNLTPDEMAQIADKMHKVMWSEIEGTVKFSVTEKYAYLTESDLVSVEMASGVMKRVRIEKITFVDGVMSIESRVDRASAYTSSATAPSIIAATVPESNYPSATTFKVMDIPVIRQSDDNLNVYVAAHGDTGTAWVGAVVDQYINGEWFSKGTITTAASIGQVEEAFADHAAGLDESNTLLVSLSDDEVASITQAAFDGGGNLALVGSEIISFKTVTAESDNYRLSYISRGLLETETNAHAVGESFVLLDNAKAVEIDSAHLFGPVTLRVYSINTLPATTDEIEFYWSGQSQVELAPNVAAMELIGTDWVFTWAHDKRIGAPVDGIASTHFTHFILRLIDGSTQIDLTTAGGYGEYADGESYAITYTEAEQIADFGAAVSAFDTVQIFGVNEYTGNGHIATPVDISGDHLLLPNGIDSLMLDDVSGVLLLE